LNNTRAVCQTEKQEHVLNTVQKLVATVLIAPGLMFYLNKAYFGLSGSIRWILAFQKFHVVHDFPVHNLKIDARNTCKIIGFVFFVEMRDPYHCVKLIVKPFPMEFI